MASGIHGSVELVGFNNAVLEGRPGGGEWAAKCVTLSACPECGLVAMLSVNYSQATAAWLLCVV